MLICVNVHVCVCVYASVHVCTSLNIYIEPNRLKFLSD